MVASNESSPNSEPSAADRWLPPDGTPPAWHWRWQVALWLALVLTAGGFGAVLFGVLGDALERQTWREQRAATHAELQALNAERVQLDRAVTELRRTRIALDAEHATAAQLRDEAASLRRELADSRAEQDGLVKRRDGLLTEIKAAETRIADLEQRRDSAEKQAMDAESRRQQATEAERTARARQAEAEQARNEALSQQKAAE